MRLPLADRVLYGLGSLGNATFFWSLSLWLIYFYAPTEGRGDALIPVAVVALARGIGGVLEAFDDPLIGWWSDRSKSRWGRRIPFLLYGIPVLVISFWLLFTPPVGADPVLLAVYFFVILEIFYFANTIVGAPYEALQAEIATSSADRVSLGVWKVLFGTMGTVLAFVVSPQLVERLGFQVTMGILAAFAFVSLYGMLFGLWRRGTLSRATVFEAAPISLGDSVKASLAHRPFLALASSFVLFSLGYNMLPVLMPYYVTVVHGTEEGEVSFFLAGVIGTVLVALPIASWAARRFGKRAVYALSMVATGVYLLFLGVATFAPLVPGVSFIWQSRITIWLSGLGFAALFVFPGAMMADVIDDDAARSGHQRAAIYYGMFKTLEKIAQSGAAVLVGLLIQVFGGNEDRSLGLQLVLPVAGVCAIAGSLAVVLGYHLRERPTTTAALDAGAEGAVRV
jgi:GPH family glycoside/pentoside/hexuronide:cation symporter